MTSQPSQSALDAETEAGIRARTGIVALTRRLVVSDSDAIAVLIEEADNDRAILLAEIDRLREALEQARDRMDGSFSHMKPDATDEDREWSAQHLWFGMGEIDAALNAGASPSTAEETPR